MSDSQTLVINDSQTGGEGPNDEAMRQAHDDASRGMTDSAAPAEAGGERPDWLPDNFNSVEDYNKSFDEQRSELTRLQQELAEMKKGGAKEEETEGETDTDEKPKEGEGDEEPKRSGKDFTIEDVQDYTNELAENGDLSEESRGKLLEMFDVPEWVLDTYIAGVAAQNEALNTKVDNAFGGTEARDAMLNWAGENLDDKQIDTLEKQLNSTDLDTQLFAIESLKVRYEASEGKAPTNRLNGGAPKANGDVFASMTEVSIAMEDPRYRNDPGYRRSVQEKLARSNV